MKLRDVLRLARPKPKDEAQSALWKRVKDRALAPPDTWEVALSGGADKKQAFERLIRESSLAISPCCATCGTWRRRTSTPTW